MNINVVEQDIDLGDLKMPANGVIDIEQDFDDTGGETFEDEGDMKMPAVQKSPVIDIHQDFDNVIDVEQDIDMGDRKMPANKNGAAVIDVEQDFGNSEEEKFDNEFGARRRNYPTSKAGAASNTAKRPGAVAVGPKRPGAVAVGGPGAEDDKYQEKLKEHDLNNYAPNEMAQKEMKKAAKDPPKKKKRKKNKYFEDLEKSGRWGDLSKKDIFIAIGVTLLIFAGIGGAIAFLVSRSSEETEPPSTEAPTVPPTSTPTSYYPIIDTDPADQLSAILESINNITYNNRPVLDHSLSEDVAFYKDKKDNEEESPMVRAMSWILYDDEADPPADNKYLVPRFALAAVYYATGGLNWSNSSKWFSVEPPCNWEGLFCDENDDVTELSLNKNNLTGSIPHELSLLTSLQVLSLSNNQLTGNIPATALGRMPSLTALYLNNNQLNGTIHRNLRLEDGSLSTIYLQNNKFTGEFKFYRRRTREDPDAAGSYFDYIGADCGNGRDALNLNRCQCDQYNSCYTCSAGYCRKEAGSGRTTP